jgi:hypothetical protein
MRKSDAVRWRRDLANFAARSFAGPQILGHARRGLAAAARVHHGVSRMPIGTQAAPILEHA